VTRPGSIGIRPYEPRDHDELVALIGRTLAEFGFASNIGGVRADLAALDERYAGARAGLWIADDGGAVLGCVAVRAKDAATCELKRLYVSPSARGRGLGQRLYEHAEAFARAAGYARIALDSSRRFAQARRLYERNGFVLVAELDNDWEDNLYEKRLDPPPGA